MKKRATFYFMAAFFLAIYLIVDIILIYKVAPPIFRLGDSARNLLLHVPVAWVSAIAYLLAAIYALVYLRKRDIQYDVKSSAFALLGLLFSMMVVITGMIWAAYDWGKAWNWDPRETTFLIMLLIYFIYFSLRSSIKQEETRARLSGVYVIFAFFTVPFLYFIIPRMGGGGTLQMETSLHPDIISEVANTASSQEIESIMSPVFFSIFIYSIIGFSLLFIFLWKITVWIRLQKKTRLLKK